MTRVPPGCDGHLRFWMELARMGFAQGRKWALLRAVFERELLTCPMRGMEFSGKDPKKKNKKNKNKNKNKNKAPQQNLFQQYCRQVKRPEIPEFRESPASEQIALFQSLLSVTLISPYGVIFISPLQTHTEYLLPPCIFVCPKDQGPSSSVLVKEGV